MVTRTSRLFEELASPAIVSAYVFGSFAEGRTHRESDLDIGVVMDCGAVPTPRDRFQASIRLSASVQAHLGQRSLDLVVLNDVPPTFARRVVLDGQRVYCGDLEADHAFVRDVQLKAADLEPFLRRTRALKLEALSPP